VATCCSNAQGLSPARPDALARGLRPHLDMGSDALIHSLLPHGVIDESGSRSIPSCWEEGCGCFPDDGALHQLRLV